MKKQKAKSLIENHTTQEIFKILLLHLSIESSLFLFNKKSYSQSNYDSFNLLLISFVVLKII